MRFLFDHAFAASSRLPPENYYDTARTSIASDLAIDKRAKRLFYDLAT